MPVYVDKARNTYGCMKMCHMVADTLQELHAMADVIGVNRKWFQNNPDHPHYDIAQSKKMLALQNGAIEVDGRQLVKWLQQRRTQNEDTKTDRTRMA